MDSSDPTSSSKNLGEILLELGVIDRDTLDRAVALQSRRLGEILIDEQLADPIKIANALKLQAQTPFADGAAGIANRQGAMRVPLETFRLQNWLSSIDACLDDINLCQNNPTAFTGIRSDHSAAFESFGAESLIRLRARLAALHLDFENVLLKTLDITFRSVERNVAATSKKLGKQVQAECLGYGLTLERGLVEDLNDALVHLVRNAVDHGIESPEVRRALEKPAYGKIRVSIEMLGNEILVMIADDGGGIDLDSVYAVAKTKKLIDTPREKISEDDLHRLLFTPGFTTKKGGTSVVSGRGVGLDVVEAMVLRRGGRVEVKSRLGQGTTFKLYLPVTLAKFPVLAFRVDGEAISRWLGTPASMLSAIEETSDVAGVLDPRSLFISSSRSEPYRLPAQVLRTKSGARWVTDEILSPEDCLVYFSNMAEPLDNILGTCRLNSGQRLLIIDFDRLIKSATPAIFSDH